MNEQNERILLLLGDQFYYLKVRYHLSISTTLFGLLAFISQLIHYSYYKNDRKPSYLRPFLMLSGFTSSQTIGLSNREDVKKLYNRTKLLLFCANFISKSSIFFAFFISFIPLSINATFIEIIFPIIPWVLIFITYCYYSANFLVYQIIYFYLICYYLKIKVINENLKINQILNSKLRLTNLNIKLILRSMKSLHSEIIEYNNNYWSEFIFWILSITITIMNMCLFYAIYGYIVILRPLFALIVITFIFLLSIILIISSSISSEVFNSYILLNKLFIYSLKNRISTTTKIKVFNEKPFKLF